MHQQQHQSQSDLPWIKTVETRIKWYGTTYWIGAKIFALLVLVIGTLVLYTMVRDCYWEASFAEGDPGICKYTGRIFKEFRNSKLPIVVDLLILAFYLGLAFFGCVFLTIIVTGCFAFPAAIFGIVICFVIEQCCVKRRRFAL